MEVHAVYLLPPLRRAPTLFTSVAIENCTTGDVQKLKDAVKQINELREKASQHPWNVFYDFVNINVNKGHFS